MRRWQRFLRLALVPLLGSSAPTQRVPVRQPRRLSFDRLEERAMLAFAPELVRDINLIAGTNGSSTPGSFVVVGETTFFTAREVQNGTELWKTDGTSAGTVLVKDIRPGSSNGYLGDLTNVNGTLYFSASDASTGSELWKSDGTSAGTVLVKDILTGAGNGSPRYLTNVNGTLYFRANDGITGEELWKSDGTSAGTVLVKDIRLGADSASVVLH